MIIPNDMIVHVSKIFEGEYDIAIQHPAPKIIDIGANVGGFAVWAKHRWPGATIDCYEPIKANYDLLERNTRGISGVTTHNVAVGAVEGKRFMHYGKYNVGECSLFKSIGQVDEGEEVNAIKADALPECDIMKIDTEGAEIEILQNLVNWPKFLLIEYHNEENRRKIDEILKDYTLFYSSSDNFYTGVVKYAHMQYVVFPEGDNHDK